MNAEVLLRGNGLASEFECELGDERRTKRLQAIAEVMAGRPEMSFPNMMESPAEVQGLYRLLRNEALTFDNVLAGHVRATSERTAVLKEVLVAHDTTEFTFRLRNGYVRTHLAPKSKSKQAFYGHLSLAASADGLRAPLGAVGFQGYVHKSQVSAETASFWADRFGAYSSEGERWVRGMESSQQALEGCRVIHVADREADRNDVLQWASADSENRGFVIRSSQKRVSPDGRRIQDELDKQPFIAERTIKLAPRSLQGVPSRSRTFPERPSRVATLSFRACAFVLHQKRESPISANVVEVVELDPPEGQAPVHWVLLTGEPIDSPEAILRIADLYRSRWLIEEFFKAIKTGCAYEKRQLDSAQTLLVALALTIPVAWTLLALRHLSRHADTVPAAAFLSPLQLAVLLAHLDTLEWSAEPTIAEACRGIARLGGHHRSNGRPGWQILGRGLQKLLTMTLGAALVSRKKCDQL